jgi:hypothetical protein
MRIVKFEKDTSENKVASFVVGCISLVLATVLTFICFSFGLGLHPKTAGEVVAMLVIWPVAMIMYLVMFSFSLTSVFSFISGCFSAKKGIKIASIILLVISIALFAFNVYMVLVSLGAF